jgi:hypothetical protein
VNGRFWTYRIQLCGTASTSNTEILERLESKVLRMIVDAPWCVPNTVIRRVLQTPTVKEEICNYTSQYSAAKSVTTALNTVRASVHTQMT